MDQKQWKQIHRIVDTALDLDKKKRRNYINEQCAEKPELKTQVTKLLESIEKSDTEDFLEDSESYPNNLIADLVNESDSASDKSALIGETINSYKITELIDHGGMGSVYLAKRADEAYHKKVALKILRRGMDTPSNIARFRRERNILAKLNHPNIARLLDGGMTKEGLPYLVMEFVEGTPLFTYCDEHRLSIEERIQLFKSACEAVQHAHNNAVIHRDLKPSNILVTENRQIKILDFGIAKLLEPEDPDVNLFETQTGARILTPGYAAPEQVQSQNITTATDIYTLGTLLYKLLAGIHPFEIEEKDFTEVERLIRRESPPKPSARLQELDVEQQHKKAHLRKLTTDKLINKLQGDLDAIIMKTQRKEPEARYDAVTQLLEDLERRDHNHPIIAREDTWRYNASKFFQRYKTVLSTAAGIVLIITGIIFYYSWQITEERNIAQTEAEKAEQVTAFLTDLIESNYPENAQGDTITVREFLNKGYDRVQQLDSSPAVKANIMQVISQTYRTLGEIDRAAPLIRKAVNIYDTLNTQPIEKAKAYHKFGLILRDQGNHSEAEKALDQAVSFFRDAGHTNSKEYARLLANMAYIKRTNTDYKEALALAQNALEIEQTLFNSAHPKIAETYYIIASILRKQDKFEEAKENQLKSLNMLQSTVEGPHPGKANNLNNLAIIYEQQDSLGKAAVRYQKSLEMSEELYGESHPEIATASSNFSKVLLQQGQIDSAEVMMEQALQITRNKMGETHPTMGERLNDYANIFREKEQYAKADSLYDQALQILENHYPDSHPKIVGILDNKAENAYLSGHIEQAEELFRKVLTIRKKRYDSPDEDIQIPLQQLLNILETKQKFSEVDSLKSLFSHHRTDPPNL